MALYLVYCNIKFMYPHCKKAQSSGYNNTSTALYLNSSVSKSLNP